MADYKKTKTYRGRRGVFCVCLFLMVSMFLLLALSGCTGLSATDVTVETLDYRAEIDRDGNLKVVERHALDFSDRGKDYWNYFKSISLDYVNLKIPTENGALSVTVDGVDYPLAGSVNPESGSVSSMVSRYAGKSYYYRDAYRDTFEMGVVMPTFSKGNHVVEFRYTIENAIVRLNDANELYMFLIPENNTMNILNMSGRISFSDSSAEKTYAWLHLESGNGGVRLEADAETPSDQENYRGNYNSIYFEAENLPAGETVEIRLTLDNAIFNQNDKLKIKYQSLEAVKSEELAFYNEYREKLKKQTVGAAVNIAIAVVAILTGVVCLVVTAIKRRPKKIEDAPEYIRDIPEDWSVEEASPVFWYYDKKDRTSETISATILKLARKYYLEIRPGEKKKEAEIRVKITEKEGLSPCEAIVLGLLEQVVPAGEPFTMKQFERWSKVNSEYVARQIKIYEKRTKEKAAEVGALPKSGKMPKYASVVTWVFIGIAAIILGNGFFNLAFGITLTVGAIGLLVGAVLISLTRLIRIPLTEKGQREYLRFKALEKYMCDFSNLKEHELPALILWEDYMVWATMMGVADKVAEQLEIAYPEYREMVMQGTNADTFLLLYLLSPRLRFSMGLNLVSNVGNVMNTVQAVNKAQQAAKMNNRFGGFGGGGHGGGGFGGGGGGFGGGGGMGAR